jgi:hypothetical protein
MKLSELQKEIEYDFSLAPDELQSKIYEIPKLHSKYLGKYNKALATYQNLSVKMSKLYRNKWHKYSKEYEYKLSSQKEIILYVEGDKDIIELRLQLDSAERIKNYLKEVVDKTKQLTFDVKNLIEFLKYIGGAV